MSADRLRGVIREADELGISIILLAGGEPLTRPEVLDITADHPNIAFPLFTNGLLIDGETIDKLAAQRHVVPVISLEGPISDYFSHLPFHTAAQEWDISEAAEKDMEALYRAIALRINDLMEIMHGDEVR